MEDNEKLYGDDPNERIERIREKLLAREQSDVRKILSTPEGRRFIWRVMAFAGVYAPSYSGQAHWETNFNEGKRSVGNLLLKDIPPEIELAMKREAANDKLLREQELKENSDGQ